MYIWIAYAFMQKALVMTTDDTLSADKLTDAGRWGAARPGESGARAGLRVEPLAGPLNRPFRCQKELSVTDGELFLTLLKCPAKPG